MSKYSSLFVAALGAAVLGSTVVVSACSSAPPLPAYAMPPSNDVKTLTFLLNAPKPGDEIIASAEDAIQSALIRAEYKITTDENDPHDAVIDIDISANQKQGGFMTVQVNGKTQYDYAIHISLSVKEGGNIVDQKVYDYTASGGQSETGNGFALINDLSSSPRFREWAKKQVAKNAPPPKPTATATSTAVAGNPKPTATATTPPAPTSTSPGGVLATHTGPVNTGGSAAGAASAKTSPRDQLGTGSSSPPPTATASAPGTAPKPGGGTSPY